MTVAQTFTGSSASADPEADRIAWHYRRMQEVENGTYKGKTPSPDFEPLPGWKPFADYGTSDPAAIIAKAARDQDTLALLPGDWFDVKLGDGSTMRYVLGSFDQYLSTENTKHHAYMIPEHVYPKLIAPQSTWDIGNPTMKGRYENSDLHSWEENTYYPMLPASLRSLIIPMYISYGYGNSITPEQPLRVFSPSIIEIVGSANTPDSQHLNREIFCLSGEHPIEMASFASGNVQPNHHVPRFRNTAAVLALLDQAPNSGTTGFYRGFWSRSLDSGVPDKEMVGFTCGIGEWNEGDETIFAAPLLPTRAVCCPLPCFCIG